MIGFFRSMRSAVWRFFARRAARRLAAEALPKGLPPGALVPLRLSLREPPPLEPPRGEFWTLPLFAESIRGRSPRRLLRLAALPPPLVPLDLVREHPALLLPRRARLPKLLDLVAPLETRVRDCGVARPSLFKLDEDLRLPVERDPLRVSSDAPALLKLRQVLPRTPLARAPISRFDPRAFRVDRLTLRGPNENLIELGQSYQRFWWVSPKLRREKVDPAWMTQQRIHFLAPLQYEWFVLWWDQRQKDRPGAREAVPYDLPRELDWALEEVKEQMLIRRDVAKDEQPPEAQEFFFHELGVAISAHEKLTGIAELTPQPAWVELMQPAPGPGLDRAAREAYLQWRTLMDGLAER